MYPVYLLLRERFSTAKIGKRKQMNKFLLLKITFFKMNNKIRKPFTKHFPIIITVT